MVGRRQGRPRIDLLSRSTDRLLRVSATSVQTTPSHHRIAIVGSGFAGLGVAIRLKQAGIEDFVVLERAERPRRHVAREHLSRAAPATSRPTCTRSRSRRTRAGAGRSRASRRSGSTCARRRASRASTPHIRYQPRGRPRRAGTSRRQLWRIETSGGELTRRAAGRRRRAAERAEAARHRRDRQLRGRRSFTPPRWDHEHALAGERVAVIGTGASSIQLVPEIQPQVRAAARSSSARRRGSCRTATGRPRAPSERSTARSRRRSGWCAAPSTGHASCSCCRSCTRERRRCPSARAQAPGQAGPRRRAARAS